jgi:GT2 family glycosyltransferase
MEAPWFRHTSPGVGEDYDWCDRARAAGFSIHVDQTLEVEHLGVVGHTPDFAAAWQRTKNGRAFMEKYIERERGFVRRRAELNGAPKDANAT